MPCCRIQAIQLYTTRSLIPLQENPRQPYRLDKSPILIPVCHIWPGYQFPCSHLLLLSPLYTVLMSRPVRRQATNSRELCWHTNDTCEFYTHCIDSIFHCGEVGFAAAYAQSWCEKIRLFHTSSSGCSSCLSNPGVSSWLQDHEQCFQQRLYKLAMEEFQGRTADPPTCLYLERQAFVVMEECYNSTAPQLCSALDNYQSTAAFQDDMTKVAEAVHVNQYYGRTSQTLLSETVRRCGHPESHTVAESIVNGPQQRRVVFCGAYRCNGEDVTSLQKLNDTFLKKIALKLNESPHEQFTYEGPVTDNRCSSTVPVGVPDSLNFHFVTWRPTDNDTLPDNLEPFYDYHNTKANVKFFDYQNPTTQLCGDGLRQAGEVCDLGVYNGALTGSHTFGCTSTCVPEIGYECSSGQLEYSQCWRKECGNGRRESGEDCDDGQLLDGDGCSSNCQIEVGFQCFTPYNKTSRCEELPPPSTTVYPSLVPTSTVHWPASSTTPPHITSRTYIKPTPTPSSLPPTDNSPSPRSSSVSLCSVPHRLLLGLLALVVLAIR